MIIRPTLPPALLRVVVGLTLAATLAACGTPQPPTYAYGTGTPDFGRGERERPPRIARAPDSAQPTRSQPTAAQPGEPASRAQPSASLPAERSLPAATPAPASEPRAGDTRQAALPPREPPAEPPRLEELRGLTTGQLALILGKPTLARQDGTAQMWQYRSEACVLYVFLYADRDQARVQHVETRARQAGAPALTSGPSECLATLIGALRARS